MIRGAAPKATLLKVVSGLVITSEDGEHLLWLGGMKRSGPTPQPYYGNTSIVRFLYERWFDVDTGKKHLKRTCSVERCVLPTHIDGPARTKREDQLVLDLLAELGL